MHNVSHLPYLPPELWDMIYKELHKMYMLDLSREIIHNVVWFRVKENGEFKYSFLTCKGNNYYKALEWVDSDDE